MTEEELFNKALEIAVSKGQVKDRELVDSALSGQQGGVYRLLSADGKVLTRIGMGLLRKPRKVKVHNVYAYLIACVVGFSDLGLGGLILSAACLFLITSRQEKKLAHMKVQLDHLMVAVLEGTENGKKRYG